MAAKSIRIPSLSDTQWSTLDRIVQSMPHGLRNDTLNLLTAGSLKRRGLVMWHSGRKAWGPTARGVEVNFYGNPNRKDKGQ